MRYSMLIDEGLWDELFFLLLIAGCHLCMHKSLARSKWKSSHTTNMARIMFSKQYVGSLRWCVEQPIGFLFCVHDVQFAIKTQAIWLCYAWCARPIAWSQWRIRLSSTHVVGRRHHLSSMLAAAGHIACCVRPSREVQIPPNRRFPIWRLRSLKKCMFSYRKSKEKCYFNTR